MNGPSCFIEGRPDERLSSGVDLPVRAVELRLYDHCPSADMASAFLDIAANATKLNCSRLNGCTAMSLNFS